MRLAIGVVLAAWLVFGAAAAGQRGYFGNDRAVNCKTNADTGLTILAGPMNYAGVNPKVHCSAKPPHPSA
jgi:hypothetical protein